MTESPAPRGAGLAPLYGLPQWVVYTIVQRPGAPKPTKIPHAPILPECREASSTDPQTWGTHSEAVSVQRIRKFHGVGFVFTSEDPYCGIDLDGCIDPETGEMQDWAWKIVEELNSYTEYSPSGTGVHIIVRGSLPNEGRKKGDVEMYDSARYFTITGNALAAASGNIEARQSELEGLHARIFPPKKAVARTRAKTVARPDDSLQDHEVIAKAMSAKQGAEFYGLYFNGPLPENPSHSEADLALANRLAFWCGPMGEEQADRIFRSSALMRPKWDQPHYSGGETHGQHTIRKAFRDRTEFYTPPKKNGDAVTRVTGDGKEDPVTPPKRKTALDLQRMPAPGFPVGALPKPCRDVVNDVVATMDCDPSLVAMPMLASLASAIGGARVVRVKGGWDEYPSLFLAVVASPGSMKSPAAKIPIRPVNKLQKDYRNQYVEARKAYEGQLRQYDVEKSDARKNGEAAPPPPDEPSPKRTIASDTTVEALTGILENNERGILVHRDELAGWIRSMDQYKGGKGSDRQHWLSMWDSQPLVVDRRSRPDPIMVDAPVISLFGGIQPALLGELGGTNEDGMMDRFLFAYPHQKAVRWSDHETDQATYNSYEALYHAMAELKPEEKNGEKNPKALTMTFEAKRLFADLYNDLAAEPMTPGFPGKLEAIWAKFRGYLARLALILAVTRSAYQRVPDKEVEKEDVEGAWELIEFFKAHAKRVFAVVEEADPVDVFAGGLKTFLEGQPDAAWHGTPTDLLDELGEEEVENLPSQPAELTKMLASVRKKTPGLSIERDRDRAKRTITVKIVTGDPLPSRVTRVTASRSGVRDAVTGVTGDAQQQPVTEEAEPTPQPQENAADLDAPCKHGVPKARDCYVCNKQHPKRTKNRMWD